MIMRIIRGVVITCAEPSRMMGIGAMGAELPIGDTESPARARAVCQGCTHRGAGMPLDRLPARAFRSGCILTSYLGCGTMDAWQSNLREKIYS